MKIATWNVNGIRARWSQLQQWIAREHPDVVCLQETKASSDRVPQFLSDMEDYWCYWHGEGGYSGVGLHILRGLAPQRPSFHHPDFDFEHRIVSAAVGAVTVASIYVPNGGRDFAAKMRFLEALEAYAGELLDTKQSVLLCGDFNVTASDQDVHPKERKARAIGQLPEERAILERIVGRGLVDVGRAVDPDNDDLYTWWPPWRQMRARNIGWRLDYIFADRALAARVVSCRVQKDVGTSDHAPVLASFVQEIAPSR